MQEGWRWLEYLKRGTTIATAPMVSEEEDADWAEVPIEYRSPDGSGAGAYNARIDTCYSDDLVAFGARAWPRTRQALPRYPTPSSRIVTTTQVG